MRASSREHEDEEGTTHEHPRTCGPLTVAEAATGVPSRRFDTAMDTPIDRRARIAGLSRLVASGTYSVPAQDVAEAMLLHALGAVGRDSRRLGG